MSETPSEPNVSSKVNHYAGLRGSRFFRSKYQGCEYSKIRGLTVRLLTQAEIAEFRAHVEKAMNRQPRRST